MNYFGLNLSLIEELWNQAQSNQTSGAVHINE